METVASDEKLFFTVLTFGLFLLDKLYLFKNSSPPFGGLGFCGSENLLVQGVQTTVKRPSWLEKRHIFPKCLGRRGVKRETSLKSWCYNTPELR